MFTWIRNTISSWWNYLKGKRTVFFGILLMMFGAIEAVDWSTMFSEPIAGFFSMGVGAIVIWLRSQTDTPIGKAE
jgi:hypothetical protein